MPAAGCDLGKLITLRYQNGLSYREIAKVVGVDDSAVFTRLQRFEALFDVGTAGQAFEARESGLLAGIRAELLAHVVKAMSDEKTKLSPYQAVGMYGLLFDKQRLLDGKSSSNLALLTRMLEGSQPIADNSACDASIKSIPVLADKTEEESGT